MKLLAEPRPAPTLIVAMYANDTEPCPEPNTSHYKLAAGGESISASHEAATMQNFGVGSFLDAQFRSPGSAPFQELFPGASREMRLNQERIFYHVLPQTHDDSWAKWEYRLHLAFDTELLEDGFDHPADGVIEQALCGPNSKVALSAFRAFSLDSNLPAFAASVLQCLSRNRCPGDSSWRVSLIEDALMIDVFQIREAALNVAITWGDPELATVLATHNEPIPWLRSRFQKASIAIRQ